MDDNITSEKQNVIDRAQAIAEREWPDQPRYTNVILWDDGDYRVDVIHGRGGDFREKIVYRSSDSEIVPGETFLKVVETVDVAAQGTTIEMKTVE